MPTAIGSLRLRSSGAHCDLKPAVEVQRCPLRSEAGEEEAKEDEDEDEVEVEEPSSKKI